MKITDTLFNTDQRRLSYVLKAIPMSSIPVFAIASLLFLIVPDLKGQEFKGGFLRLLLTIVIIGPIVETLLMWPAILLIKIFTKSTWKIAFISGLFWAFLHSLVKLPQGVSVFWLFVVLSICFVEWRKKSFAEAFWLTASIHMSHNFFAFTLLQIGQMCEQGS